MIFKTLKSLSYQWYAIKRSSWLINPLRRPTTQLFTYNPQQKMNVTNSLGQILLAIRYH